MHKVTSEDLHVLSEFRFELRRFLRASEELCKAEGVTPTQYQMLLQTRSVPGRTWILVHELATRLQSSPHGAVALVSRGEAAGLVIRKPNPVNRREVQVHATPLGRQVLERLATKHLHELGTLAKVFQTLEPLTHDLAALDAAADSPD